MGGWHTPLEFCGLVGILMLDEDGINDPHLLNDRFGYGDIFGPMSPL
jgi:hypothetical protein